MMGKLWTSQSLAKAFKSHLCGSPHPPLLLLGKTAVQWCLHGGRGWGLVASPPRQGEGHPDLVPQCLGSQTCLPGGTSPGINQQQLQGQGGDQVGPCLLNSNPSLFAFHHRGVGWCDSGHHIDLRSVTVIPFPVPHFPHWAPVRMD